MSELVESIKNFQNLQKAAIETLHQSFDESQLVEGKDHMEQVREKTTAEFSLYYTLYEAISCCDDVIKEKPSREVSLAKTKLQEALFWLNEAQ